MEQCSNTVNTVNRNIVNPAKIYEDGANACEMVDRRRYSSVDFKTFLVNHSKVIYFNRMCLISRHFIFMTYFAQYILFLLRKCKVLKNEHLY